MENRARILLEVLHEVRGAFGPEVAVIVKLDSDDYLTGGLHLEDSLQVGMMLRQAGMDAIALSGGTIASGDLSPSRPKTLSQEKGR